LIATTKAKILVCLANGNISGYCQDPALRELERVHLSLLIGVNTLSTGILQAVNSQGHRVGSSWHTPAPILSPYGVSISILWFLDNWISWILVERGEKK
jgi:hypothetical protein